MFVRDASGRRVMGDERLSDGQHGESDREARDKDPANKVADPKPDRKPRGADIGRALRSVYDDTLRESVPDDFSDLLGKLS